LLARPNSVGHVGAICMSDPYELSAPLDLGALTELVNERAPLIPLQRQKLRTVPLGLDQPGWVDDDSFDVEYHVREISLPTPGSDAQLAEQISRIHARRLDRSKPLWEIYLVSRLSDGRQEMYTKIHHAAIDGVSGTELMGLLLDFSPAGRDLAPLNRSDRNLHPEVPLCSVGQRARWRCGPSAWCASLPKPPAFVRMRAAFPLALAHSADLADHIEVHVTKDATALLFPPARAGCHLNDRVMRDYLAPALKAIGREGVRIHDLRHFAGTQTARIGNLVETITRISVTEESWLLARWLATGYVFWSCAETCQAGGTG
jgi:WS/DGAT/MGAT family acyltransferase